MCRLAYVTTRFPGLGNWFSSMEKSFGGDGNGLAVGRNVVKGLNLTVQQSVSLLREWDGPAIWHTRRVSSGPKCSELCHPFRCGKGWLVHNGHWQTGADAAFMMLDLGRRNQLSDTRLFALLASRLGFVGAAERYQPNGIWLRMSFGGRLHVYKNGGSLFYSPSLDAWGSEPAKRGHWFEVADGLYGPGEMPKQKPDPKPELTWRTGNSQSTLFDPLTESDRRLPEYYLRQMNGFASR